MKKPLKYLIIIFVVSIVLFIIYKRNQNTVTYYLPTDPDPNVFGPYYWKAFHQTADRIPCPLCKPFAQKFMIFFHDVVNKKLNKPIYDPENYTEVLNEINA